MKLVYVMNFLVRVSFFRLKDASLIEGRFFFHLVEASILWSNWTRIKDELENEEITTEVRTRFVCSMTSELKIQSDQINYRICRKKESKCYETG